MTVSSLVTCLLKISWKCLQTSMLKFLKNLEEDYLCYPLKCIMVSVLWYLHHKIAQIDNGWTLEAPLWRKQKDDSPGYDMFSSGSVTWDIIHEYNIPERVEIGEERRRKKREKPLHLSKPDQDKFSTISIHLLYVLLDLLLKLLK